MSTDNDSLRADYAALVQRLAQVEQQNLTLMRGNADAMLIVDGDGTIRYANPAVEPLLDHDAAGLVGLPFGHPLAGKGPATIEIGQHEGTQRVVEMQVSAGMWEGAPVSIVTLRETTALARAEAQVMALRAANAELARAAQAKDDFLAAMGHELRTPLNAVLSLSRVLHDQLEEHLSDHQHQSFDVITESGQHLLALINDILDLAKVQAGMMNLDIKTVEIDALCSSALNIVRQLAEQKGLRLSEHFDDRVRTVQVDPLRLKQILVNLLSNAVKFTPEGGTVGVDVIAQREQNVVQITVWDTGIGIDPKDLSRLFKPFVQIDNELPQLFAGTGLGLALSQRLANQHGGEISVTSMRGAGSRFTVTLPWNEKDADIRSEMPPPVAGAFSSLPRREPNGASHKVLLAEDSEANIFAISAYLEMCEVPVLVARTGPEALELANSEHPDMILMDLNLPRLDGLEVIRRLRSSAEFEGVPIVIISALSDDNERVRTSGADHFLSKPIDLDKLDDLMERYFT